MTVVLTDGKNDVVIEFQLANPVPVLIYQDRCFISHQSASDVNERTGYKMYYRETIPRILGASENICTGCGKIGTLKFREVMMMADANEYLRFICFECDHVAFVKKDSYE